MKTKRTNRVLAALLAVTLCAVSACAVEEGEYPWRDWTLEVTKVVAGGGTAALTKTFHFVVYQEDAVGHKTYYLQDGTTTTDESGAKIAIANGEVKRFEKLDLGTYNVKELIGDEDQVPGYYLTATGSGKVEVKASETAPVKLTNTYELAKLVVSKRVLRPSGGVYTTTQEFAFTLTLTGVNGAASVTIDDGTGAKPLVLEKSADGTSATSNFKITGNGSVTIGGLPVGATYKLEETTVSGYTLSGVTVNGKTPNIAERSYSDLIKKRHVTRAFRYTG